MTKSLKVLIAVNASWVQKLKIQEEIGKMIWENKEKRTLLASFTRGTSVCRFWRLAKIWKKRRKRSGMRINLQQEGLWMSWTPMIGDQLNITIRKIGKLKIMTTLLSTLPMKEYEDQMAKSYEIDNEVQWEIYVSSVWVHNTNEAKKGYPCVEVPRFSFSIGQSN